MFNAARYIISLVWKQNFIWHRVFICTVALNILELDLIFYSVLYFLVYIINFVIVYLRGTTVFCELLYFILEAD